MDWIRNGGGNGEYARKERMSERSFDQRNGTLRRWYFFEREGSNQCKDTTKERKRKRSEEKNKKGRVPKMQHCAISIIVETAEKHR